MLAVPDDHWKARIEAVGLAGAGKVLDVGCGCGAWLPALARVNDAVVGVDSDARAVEAARLRVAGVKNVEIWQMAAERLACAAASFDAVGCFSTLPYLDQNVAVAEMARVVKPGGRLVIGTVGCGYVRCAARGALRRNTKAMRYGLGPVLVAVGRALAGERWASGSVRAWTPRAIRRLLEQHAVHVDGVIRSTAAIDPTWPESCGGLPMCFVVCGTRRGSGN